MRLALAAITAALLLMPSRAHACGQGYRVSPYENLAAASAGLFLLDLVMLPVASLAPRTAPAEVAIAGLSAASFLAIGLSPDARTDGVKPMYLGAAAGAALLVAHGIWMMSGGDRPTFEVSAGTGVGHGTAGGQFGLRYGIFGAHLGAGAPLASGNQGVSGGVSFVGRGSVAPLVALNAALQVLPYATAESATRALMSFSLDVGVRLRGENLFLDLAAGPVAQRIAGTSLKPWRNSYPDGSGWSPSVQEGGAWPLPIDVTLAVGREF